ncbi:unnamed protein product [Heligmosomoides polygyrus]|uniref:Uncharacterized protein n=1 Tax=Heligmosomoides polygyrus TaxID=6339 RepID=A0A183F4C4_HELPZ|nr:unnamed protein product [Heligmosomoides polygyrus]
MIGAYKRIPLDHDAIDFNDAQGHSIDSRILKLGEAETPAGLAEILAMQSQQLQLLQQLVKRLIEQRDPTSKHAVQHMPAIDPHGDLVCDLPAIRGVETESVDRQTRQCDIQKLRRARLTAQVTGHRLGDYDPKTDSVIRTETNADPQTIQVSSIDISTSHQLVCALPAFNNIVKKKFEDASMKDVDGDSLKCLVFIAGLTDSSHSEMRLRLLNHLNRMKEDEPSPILDYFINE